MRNLFMLPFLIVTTVVLSACSAHCTKLDSRVVALEKRIAKLECPGERCSCESPIQTTSSKPKTPRIFTPEGMQEQEMSSQKRREEVENTVATEQRDPEWADTVESMMTNLVSKSNLKGTRLESMVCRTSICMMTLMHDSEDDLFQYNVYFEERLFDLTFDHQSIGGDEQRLDGGAMRTTVYIHR